MKYSSEDIEPQSKFWSFVFIKEIHSLQLSQEHIYINHSKYNFLLDNLCVEYYSILRRNSFWRRIRKLSRN